MAKIFLKAQFIWFWVVVFSFLLGCLGAKDKTVTATDFTTVSKPASTRKIVVIGDSLAAGYGVDAEAAFPKILEKKLNKNRTQSIEVINASISGSLSSSAQQRMRWALKLNPEVIVLELGANDGLQGKDPQRIQSFLQQGIDVAHSQDVPVVLAGMKMLTNLGEEYGSDFEKIYQNLGHQKGVILVPFLLEGIAGKEEYLLPDGLHPNESGHKKMAETLFPYLVDQL